MALIAATMAGVAIGSGGMWLYINRPKDPIFEVVEINLKGFNVRFENFLAVVDVELVLSIKVVNKNVAGIEYTATIMDIFYMGDRLGQARVEAGSQDADSERVIDVVCKLDGMEMTSHTRSLLKDVARREMNLHATVKIAGKAKLWIWTHNFEVTVNSDIKVDPVYMNVIAQENKAQMELASPI